MYISYRLSVALITNAFVCFHDSLIKVGSYMNCKTAQCSESICDATNIFFSPSYIPIIRFSSATWIVMILHSASSANVNLDSFPIYNFGFMIHSLLTSTGKPPPGNWTSIFPINTSRNPNQGLGYLCDAKALGSKMIKPRFGSWWMTADGLMDAIG